MLKCVFCRVTGLTLCPLGSRVNCTSCRCLQLYEKLMTSLPVTSLPMTSLGCLLQAAAQPQQPLQLPITPLSSSATASASYQLENSSCFPAWMQNFLYRRVAGDLRNSAAAAADPGHWQISQPNILPLRHELDQVCAVGLFQLSIKARTERRN